MSGPLGHERQITFLPRNGHTHNGENSSPVELQSGQVHLSHLSADLLDHIQNLGSDSGGSGTNADDQLVPIPDLEIETDAIGAGGSLTGSIDWVGVAVVRSVRIVMSAESECTITFYHSASYADEDREFRARRCSTKFLWEGPWVHWDEDESNKIHYRIQNTGTASARFNVTLKAGTLVANTYANFVSGLRKQGSSEDAFIGDVFLAEGSGIKITPDATNNSFTFDAVAPEAITINRVALVPKKHASYSSSTSTTSSGNGLNGTVGTGGYVNFGAGPQWLKVDFGSTYEVGRVVVTFYADGRTYNDVIIEASGDNNTWTTLMSQQSGVMGVLPGIMIDTPTGFMMRYLRIWSNGSSLNTSNHLSGAVIYAISDKVGT